MGKELQNKEIKSHISLSKSILERWKVIDSKTNRHLIYYYDFDKKEIKSKTTKSFNIELGYYSRTNEKRLKDYSEDPIGRVIKELQDNYINHGIDFVLPSDSLKTIKKYITYQLLRDDSAVKLLIDSGYVLLKKTSDGINLDNYCFHSQSIRDSKNDLIEMETDFSIIFSVLDRLAMVIIFNNSDIRYLVSSSTTVLNPNSKEYYGIMISLAPNIIVMLCDEQSLKEVTKTEGNLRIKETNEIDFVLDYNRRVFETAKKNKPHYVAGFPEELQLLIEQRDRKTIFPE